MHQVSLISTSQEGLGEAPEDQSSQEDKSLGDVHEKRLEDISQSFGHSSCNRIAEDLQKTTPMHSSMRDNFHSLCSNRIRPILIKHSYCVLSC
jgi:hypothetical protein